ncbi:MAG: diadenylate cyclase [Desulfobacteraceae bacterium]|nr:diadenylate cyclase [Desulfobacteraceae bacterium]
MKALISFLLSIRWQDIADVLLNSYILFRLYVLFRGTNVIRVIAGLALLWMFQRVAVTVGLIVTSWALQGIITVAALIIVIVFRNEIRNVLQAKNLRALLWEFPQKVVRTPVDAIVEGIYELTRGRIGALLVLPGKEDLDESVQGGVAWDGIVSKEMLISIFWNGNPVHDGAAILQGNRIARVGVILPLSQRDDLPQYYGTRHRAAAGLAEKTDALVIVVSEERRKVTAAKGNDLIPIEDNLALRRILLDHWGAAARASDGFRRERRELLFAAVICLLCMSGVWFSFAKGMETMTSIEVPLEYLNRDSRMQIVSTSDNTVRLYLSGSSALLSSLRPDQVRAKLDLSNAVNGTNHFSLGADNVIFPPGLRLSRIEPSDIKVVLDVPAKKAVPVQVDWVGALPEGLILESVAVEPAKITVSGPQSVLGRTDTIYTEKVDLSSLHATGRMTVSVVIESAALKLADDQKDKVDVIYTIGKRPL